ncbi:hypothetical protein BDF20DRAFT_870780 [Mycotypha africana]|uniref:uncharacterized protein n=1 Tax=Mycotypha africana TaxID=64632 RepID=UPI0022FFFB4A|nr:uncharacterized protein BDF20DRAFT_870780 [Mycotypha africana]KAI8979647.1 hypothetical protein BDF20DRAFT_870780 [Mycotypha africana]
MNNRIKTNSNKINTKFEGYKLKPFPNKSDIVRTSLASDNIQIWKSTTDQQRLSFRELQARIRQSQLIYGQPLDENRGTAFCIDEEYNVHMIIYDKSNKQTTFNPLLQLIKPISTTLPNFTEPTDTTFIEPQIPSAISINHELLLATNGSGHIELIGITENNGTMVGVILGRTVYPGAGTEGVTPVPCVLLDGRQITNKIIFVLYSRAADTTPVNTNAERKTLFNIVTMEITIPTKATPQLDDGTFQIATKVLNIQRGTEVPVYCAITASGQHCIFGSEVCYESVKINDEDAAEMNNEDVVGTTASTEVVEQNQQSRAAITKEVDVEQPYQWFQEGPDITIHFQLPSNTPKNAIVCKFLPDHLSLLIKDTRISYPYRKLWSTIRPDASVWTLDPTSSILTLNITKYDEVTRWPQFFDQDDDVLETLTPHHLSDIKEKLAKFTSTTTEDEDMATTTTKQSINPSSFIQPAQHPASMDIDEDIDSAGESITFSIYDNQSRIVVDSLHTGVYRWICDSFQSNQRYALPSVCLQMDVDGLVFNIYENVENHKIELQHVATFDAFAFVRASKRDARFIKHDSNFSFSCVIESSRNCYIYYHHDDKRVSEVQTLVDLTQGHDTEVIGAQLILDRTLMILTEDDIIVINV